MSTLAHTTTCQPSATPATEYARPRVNLRQDENGYLLEAELPGVPKDGVEVTVENGRLTVTGRRPEIAEPGTVVYRESRPRAYRRVFDLDPSIDASRIQASIEQGLLTVRLPQAETVKPRKITVS